MFDYYKKIVGEENWKKKLEIVVETSYMPQLDTAVVRTKSCTILFFTCSTGY